MAAAAIEKRLTTKRLCEELEATSADVRRWVKAGLPHERKGAARLFDLPEVEQWLLDRGYAKSEEPIAVARTWAELAKALGMTGKDPTRICQRWASMPGFPGRPATMGKQDGHLPVEEIRLWLATRMDGRGSRGIGADTEELRELDLQRRRLALEVESRNLQEQLGRLADVEEVARFNRQCVANAVAILEPLADEVVQALPSETSEAMRAAIHSRVTQMLDDAREAIARITEGDDEKEDGTET